MKFFVLAVAHEELESRVPAVLKHSHAMHPRGEGEREEVWGAECAEAQPYDASRRRGTKGGERGTSTAEI